MKKLEEKEYPIWVIYQLYKKVFPNKSSIASGVHKFTGSSYEYVVKIKHNISENTVKTSDIEIHKELR